MISNSIKFKWLKKISMLYISIVLSILSFASISAKTYSFENLDQSLDRTYFKAFHKDVFDKGEYNIDDIRDWLKSVEDIREYIDQNIKESNLKRHLFVFSVLASDLSKRLSVVLQSVIDKYFKYTENKLLGELVEIREVVSNVQSQLSNLKARLNNPTNPLSRFLKLRKDVEVKQEDIEYSLNAIKLIDKVFSQVLEGINALILIVQG